MSKRAAAIHLYVAWPRMSGLVVVTPPPFDAESGGHSCKLAWPNGYRVSD